MEIPNLVDIQLASYERFLQRKTLLKGEPPLKQGLEEVFQSTFPIESPNGDMLLEYCGFTLDEPNIKFGEQECKQKGLTYAIPLKAKINLIFLNTGEIRQKEIYMGDIPIMTDKGTFVVNGAERVVVSQIHRSPGVIFSHEKGVYSSRIIPYRGSWLEFEIDQKKELIYAKIDRKKRILATIFLRALGYETRESIIELFYHVQKVKITDTREDKEKLVGRNFARGVTRQGRGRGEEALPGRRQDPSARRGGARARGGEGNPPHRFRARELAALPDHPQLLRARGDEVHQGGPRAGRDLQGRRDPARVLGDQAGRAHHHRERGEGPALDVLLQPALRPGPGGPLQAEQEVRLQGAGEDAHPDQGRHHQHDDVADPGVHRRDERRRHRPPGQPARALRRRASHQPAEGRLHAHGAHRQGAHVAEGSGHDQAAGPDLHQAHRGHDQGVLRLQPAFPVHGPGQPAGRAHAQAEAQRAGARRPLPRPGGLRGPRRPLHALRPDVPHRDPRRSEHRPHRLPGQLHAGQRVRVPRDPVPQGEEREGHQRDRIPLRHGRGALPHRAGQRAPLRQGRVPGEAGLGAEGRGLHHPRTRGHPVHGRLPEADHLRVRLPHPFPRARRRQPRPHGIQHAAPGGAPDLPRAPARRHGHGGEDGVRLRRRGHRAALGDGVLRHLRRDPHQAGRGEEGRGRLPAPEVPAHQPGHLLHAEAHRAARASKSMPGT